jgi:hypothetical protein
MFKELIQGRTYWLSLSYAPMPQYSDKVSVGTIDVPVLDMSRSTVARQVVGWLKKRKEEGNED